MLSFFIEVLARIFNILPLNEHWDIRQYWETIQGLVIFVIISLL